MSFGSPSLLFGLLAVPAGVIGYALLERRRERRAASWSRHALLPNIVRRPSRRLAHIPAALFTVGLLFLLLGFARPQRQAHLARVQQPTVVLAFDVSGSMASGDVQPSRIRAARDIAIRLVHELPSNDRVAVVTFADKPRLMVAPTVDRQAVIAGLPSAVTPRGATALGDGISYAVAVIGAAAGAGAERPGAVVVLSDGAQTAGGTTPEEAAVIARVDGIPVDAVAIGTLNGVVSQPVNGGALTATLQAPVQPAALRSVARETGGAFFAATAATQSPDWPVSVFGSLHPNSSVERTKRELTEDATAVALAFILAGVVVSGLWFGRIA